MVDLGATPSGDRGRVPAGWLPTWPRSTLEGRRLRRSREMRAMATRTAFGRNLIAEQWAVAEFAALSRLWSLGAPVPYPVQRDGTELLLEFLGSDDGTAAPRAWRSSGPARTNCVACGSSSSAPWTRWPAPA